MNQHLFISPVDSQSPRWLLAFPDAQMQENYSAVKKINTKKIKIIWLVLANDEMINLLPDLVNRDAYVVVLTKIESPLEARRALEMGASGYVHYLATAELLQQVAQVVLAGGMWLGADLMRQLVAATSKIIPREKEVRLDITSLTEREKSVAVLVAKGKSNKEVARQLDITERTVKAHLSVVFEKLKVRDRLHLALVFSDNTE
jgi:DNA-binding NarL/FixJ family response regulator